MKIKSLLLFLAVFSYCITFSQNLNLSILTIPDSLTKNANSVIELFKFEADDVIEIINDKMIDKQ